ncbi:MAG: hypothetical protein ACR2MX_00030 [Cyclobacteriaceae bacterium]
MGQLNQEQLVKIEDYLDQQGLTFKPLRDEMADHLIEDLKTHIDKGNSFDEAWNLVLNNIPDHHFKTIQRKVMEAIDKRFIVVKGFTYLSLIMLLTIAIFKLVHLPLIGILWLVSVAAMAASLLSGTLLGLYLNKEKKGGLVVLGVVAGIVLYLISFGLNVLHLPPYIGLRTISVIFLILLFSSLTIYFGTNRGEEEHVLIYLHKKNSSGIELYLIILFLIATTLRIASIAFGYDFDVSNVLLFLVVAGAGFHYFILNWHDQGNQNWWLQIGLVLAFIGFILPSMTSLELSSEVRVVLTAFFWILAGIIVLYKSYDVVSKAKLIFVVTIVSTFSVILTLIKLNVIDPMLNPVIFNVAVLAVLLASLIFSIKHQMLKIYMIIVIAHYLGHFPEALGLW